MYNIHIYICTYKLQKYVLQTHIFCNIYVCTLLLCIVGYVRTYVHQSVSSLLGPISHPPNPVCCNYGYLCVHTVNYLNVCSCRCCVCCDYEPMFILSMVVCVCYIMLITLQVLSLL